MSIIILESRMQFKNPIIGQQTRTVEEHYHARRLKVLVNGEERHFRFTSDVLPFAATEDDMIAAIQNQLLTEQ